MDVYYNPEKFGLRIVEEHGDNSYDYDIVVLWADVKTNRWFWAADSGCSCNTPFENYTSVSDLNEWHSTRHEYAREVRRVKGFRV